MFIISKCQCRILYSINDLIRHSAYSAAHIMMSKMVNVFYQIKPIYWFTKNYQLEKKHIYNGVLKIADEICEEKQHNSLREDQEIAYNDEDGFSKNSKNFISALLNPKNRLSDQEIKDEINTLIAAVN